jgi:hypothetical protein
MLMGLLLWMGFLVDGFVADCEWRKVVVKLELLAAEESQCTYERNGKKHAAGE